MIWHDFNSGLCSTETLCGDEVTRLTEFQFLESFLFRQDNSKPVEADEATDFLNESFSISRSPQTLGIRKEI